MKGIAQTVEPIRDKKQIEKMKKYLMNHNERDYVLFVVGINSGLRISDLLKLRVEDVQGKDRVILTEQKTGKVKNFRLGDGSIRAIKSYLKNTGMTEGWLFPSRKGDNPITRIQAYRIINDAGVVAGVKDNIGTHTMRKTFGYHAYRQGVDIAMIMQTLNHSSASITKRYIGITQDELDEVYVNLDL